MISLKNMRKTESDSLKKISVSFLKEHKYFKGYQSGTMHWINSCSDPKSSVSIIASTGDEEYFRTYYTQTDNDTNDKKEFDCFEGFV